MSTRKVRTKRQRKLLRQQAVQETEKKKTNQAVCEIKIKFRFLTVGCLSGHGLSVCHSLDAMGPV